MVVWRWVQRHWLQCLISLAAVAIACFAMYRRPQALTVDTKSAQHATNTTIVVACHNNAAEPARKVAKDIHHDLLELGSLSLVLRSAEEHFSTVVMDFIAERGAVLSLACALKYKSIPEYIRGRGRAAAAVVERDLLVALRSSRSCHRSFDALLHAEGGSHSRLLKAIEEALEQVGIAERGEQGRQYSWADGIVREDFGEVRKALQHARESMLELRKAYQSYGACMRDTVQNVFDAWNEQKGGTPSAWDNMVIVVDSWEIQII